MITFRSKIMRFFKCLKRLIKKAAVIIIIGTKINLGTPLGVQAQYFAKEPFEKVVRLIQEVEVKKGEKERIPFFIRRQIIGEALRRHYLIQKCFPQFLDKQLELNYANSSKRSSIEEKRRKNQEKRQRAIENYKKAANVWFPNAFPPTVKKVEFSKIGKRIEGPPTKFYEVSQGTMFNLTGPYSWDHGLLNFLPKIFDSEYIKTINPIEKERLCKMMVSQTIESLHISGQIYDLNEYYSQRNEHINRIFIFKPNKYSYVTPRTELGPMKDLNKEIEDYIKENNNRDFL